MESVYRIIVVALLILCGYTSQCWSQRPIDIFPPNPFPRQIVLVRGNAGTTPSAFQWGGGSSAGNRVDQSHPASRYIQIPPNAREGRNSLVARPNGNPRLRDTIAFDVRPMVGAWPDPRIEEVTINRFDVLPSGRADVLLFVSVANVDIRAEVRVNNILSPSILYSAIVTDYFNRTGEGRRDARTYKYPIYHYGGLLVSVRDQRPGVRLHIEVRNIDSRSDTISFTLPASAAELDSDNDGLLDTWEVSGYRAPNGSVINLAEMGCHPGRKDILVEVDWMRSANPMRVDGPGESIWDDIIAVFRNGPVLNPDGSAGIDLHIDWGQHRSPRGPIGPFAQGGTILNDFQYLNFGPPSIYGLSPTDSYGNMCVLKNRWFSPARDAIFHYCIFGLGMPNGGSGRAESPGNEFFVTVERLPNPEIAASRAARIGIFIHELGHNLGLHHNALYRDPPDGRTWSLAWTSSDYNEAYRPNQPSVMNYRYSLRGISTDCMLCPDTPVVYSFSQGMLMDIYEPEVNETAGICGSSAIDFNRDGELSRSVSVNTNGVHPVGTLGEDRSLCIGHSGSPDTDQTDRFIDYNEWGNLRLNWRILVPSPWGCR